MVINMQYTPSCRTLQGAFAALMLALAPHLVAERLLDLCNIMVAIETVTDRFIDVMADTLRAILLNSLPASGTGMES